MFLESLRHFKFCVLIDTEEYERMRDILLWKGMCWESLDMFKFWEINQSINQSYSCKYENNCALLPILQVWQAWHLK